MSRRPRRTPAILRELRAIREAILAASDVQREHRETIFQRGVRVLRAALDEGQARAVVIEPATANDTTANDTTAGPTTMPGAPANDDTSPPESGARRET